MAVRVNNEISEYFTQKMAVRVNNETSEYFTLENGII